ncbi:LuxR C-terminal-related transcriptional regulator [Streptomyces sp. NPDC056486]|uniref:LuxR C-terminal-related transcriptional regulator n=1 Tax=Streptomyces sp. NPDC056486 TaxID=3345835 RepID=UPI0036A24CF0
MAAYARALRDSGISSQDVAGTPCLVDFGLLRPDADSTQWLRPVSPSVILPQLLQGIADGIAHQRRRKAQLAFEFDRLISLAPNQNPATGASGVVVLKGFPRIDEVIDQTTAATTDEIRIIQPGGQRLPGHLADSRPVEQRFLQRGGRIRTLYQHTTRHSLATLAHYERLQGNVEVRTLDELPERLFVFDQRVAMIPTREALDVAIQLRHPAVVAHLAAGFELLWRRATPMYPAPAPLPTPAQDGITTRQRAIATLLTEGLTDTEIATRLGMNVRTTRAHISKLSTILDSRSRAQLGYLIGKSGILGPEV